MRTIDPEQFRPTAECLPSEGAALVHAVSFKVNDKGILIMAPSGVGKSTQLGLWKEILGDKVEVINDDKPILRYDERNKETLITSSPLCGKEGNRSEKTAVLGAAIILDGKEDYINPEIRRVSAKEAAVGIMLQFYMPKDIKNRELTLELISKIFTDIPIYILKRNKTKECAQLCIDAILGKQNEI